MDRIFNLVVFSAGKGRGIIYKQVVLE